MKTRRRSRASPPLPLLLAGLAFASWETAARRAAMMAAGTCSAAEYRRMLLEKVAAARQSGRILLRRADGDVGALLAPWARRARANARRLRRR